MPPSNRPHLDKDFVAIGRRFACCANVAPREDLESIAWQTGIIRAATEIDSNDADQQFCVEWDGKDPVREYQWIHLHDTPEEDRYENVEGGNFSCFLIEDRLMWAENDGQSNGTSSKASKVQSGKIFRPAATFIALVDEIDYNARNRVPVRLLSEKSLLFVDKDQLNAFPVQQHQTSLSIKGSSSVPVQKDHQIAINSWFEIRRSLQRLRDKDKQLIGQSVQVYWKDGANNRWYSACLKGYNAKDQTVTVMDYNVIQDRKVDPRLEEIQIVKDYGRSAGPSTSTSTSPTPLDTGRSARSRRVTTKSEVSLKAEKNLSSSKNKKATSSSRKALPAVGGKPKTASKAKRTADTELLKRPRGRPPVISKKKKNLPGKALKKTKGKRKASTSTDDQEEEDEDMVVDEDDDDDEELTLQVKESDEMSLSAASDTEEDEELTWSLPKITTKKGKAAQPRSAAKGSATVAPPGKRKAKSPSPAQQQRLPLKKRVEKKDSDNDDEESHGSLSEDDSVKRSTSESDRQSRKKEPAVSKRKTKAPVKEKRKGAPGRKARSKVSAKSESPNRIVSSRARKQPVSYREKSEASEQSGDEANKEAEKLPAKVELPEEKPAEIVKAKVPAYNPLNVRKVKPRKQPEKAATPPAHVNVVGASLAESPLETSTKLSKESIDVKPPDTKSNEKGAGGEELATSSPAPIQSNGNQVLKHALAAPLVTSSLSSHSNMWTDASKASVSHSSSRTTPKKMARVAGQPQGISAEFPREAEASLHQGDGVFHQQQQHGSGERSSNNLPVQHPSFPGTAAPVVAPPVLPSSQMQAQPAAVLPQAVASPMDFYHQASQQHGGRYPAQQFGQYPGYPGQQPQAQAGATAQQRHPAQQPSSQQAAGNSPSPFRATTPSPFVPRNSPVTNPQQQQQQQQSQTSQQSAYRGSATSQSASQYSAPQSHQQQQPHQMSSQNYPTGIAGYGSPAAFYYPGQMMGGAGGFAGGAAALMYGNPAGAGGAMYPMHLQQGGQWDPSVMYPMMASMQQQHGNRAQTEEFQRMAAAVAAQAAAGNRAVRSTATSPDLRPSSNSNHLTGVISGAMAALNNFTIPSPPLGGASFGGYPSGGSSVKHSSSSGSPSPAMAQMQQHKDSHRPSSTHSNASSGKTSRTPEPSSAMRNSPSLPQTTAPVMTSYPPLTAGFPMPPYSQPKKGRERPAPKSKQNSEASKKAPTPVSAAPEKPPRKRSRKKAVPPVETVLPAAGTAIPLPPPMSAPSTSANGGSFAGEPCPLTMLSAVATSMMPVDVQPLFAPAVLPSVKAAEEVQSEGEKEHVHVATDVGAPTVDEAVVENAPPLAVNAPEKMGRMPSSPTSRLTADQPETAVTEASQPPSSPPATTRQAAKDTLPATETVVSEASTIGRPTDPPDQPVTTVLIVESTVAEIATSADKSSLSQETVVNVTSTVLSTPAAVQEEKPATVEGPTTTTPNRQMPIVSYPNSDEEEEEDDQPRLRICEENAEDVDSLEKKTPALPHPPMQSLISSLPAVPDHL